MAKKKKFKKHQFKDRSTNVVDTTTTSSASSGVDQPAKAQSPAVPVQDPQLVYVQRDVRKVVVLGGSFIALQLILWYIFNTTGLGASIQSLINL